MLRITRVAFTLAEVLVAMAIFVTLMAIASAAFASFSRAGERAVQGLDLQARARALRAAMDQGVGRLTPIGGLRYEHAPTTLPLPPAPEDDPTVTEVYPEWRLVGLASRAPLVSEEMATLTRQRQVRMEGRVGGGSNQRLRNHLTLNEPDTDLTWLWLSYRQGRLYAAYSPKAERSGHVDADESERGMEDTHIDDLAFSWRRPVVQKDLDYLLGTGPVTSDNLEAGAVDGRTLVPSSAIYHEGQLLRYTFDYTALGLRGGNSAKPFVNSTDTRHAGLQLPQIVRHADGRSFNRDLTNLVGARATTRAWMTGAQGSDTSVDVQVYMDRRRQILSGIEGLRLEFVQSSDLDVQGLEANGRNDLTMLQTWPTHIRYQAVVHVVDDGRLDDMDVDRDGITDELLVSALRGAATGNENSDLHQRLLDRLAAANEVGLYVTGTVPLRTL